MSVVVVIPARAGSTRVVKKNFRTVHGVPLTAWTLRQALALDGVDRVLVSSDDRSLEPVLRKALDAFSLSTRDWSFVERSPEHATATARVFDYYLDEWNRELGMSEDDLLVSLLPTAPLRSRSTTESALSLAQSSGRAVFTAVEYEFPVSFAFTYRPGGEWAPAFSDSPMITGITRSQDQKVYLHPNGAFTSMWGCQLAERPPSFYADGLCIRANRRESADVDTELDLSILESRFPDDWDAAWIFGPGTQK